MKISLTLLCGLFLSAYAVKSEGVIQSTPNSSVKLDFSVNPAESWDAKNKPKNLITNCIDGSSITGFEYSNIKLQTFAGSYLKEAIIGFSNTSPNDEDIQLVIGAGRNEAGTAIFSSNGIIDITDIGLDDVVSLSDNKFLIQFYEEVDDVRDAVDAKYSEGTLTVWGVDLVATDSCQFISGKGGTDISVSYELAQSKIEKAQTGDNLNLSITVRNHTGFVATGVMLKNTLSNKLDFVGMTCDDGTSVNNVADIAQVNVQNIGSYASLNCDLNVNVIADGDITNSVTVSADNDTTTANNSATLVIAGTQAPIAVPILNFKTLIVLVFFIFLLATSGLRKFYIHSNIK